ncbi:MAG: hypothetical protein ACQEQU_08125 [Spirochaetota bacterium]
MSKGTIYRILVVISCFAVLAMPVAAGQQRIYPTDSQEYRILLLLQTIAPAESLSSSGPWSQSELIGMLSKIDVSRLDADSAAVYESLSDKLREKDAQTTSISFSSQITGELYAHTNTGDFFDSDENWVQDYTHRSSLFDGDLSLNLDDHFFGFLRYNVRPNRFHAATGDSTGFFGPSWSTNLILDNGPEYINYTSPWRAYLSVGGEKWNVQFGRDRLKWGTSSLGNLIINDHMDFHELVRLTLFPDQFKLTSAAMLFDHPATYTTEDSDSESPSTNDPIQSFDLFIGHRLEIPLGERFRIALSEGMMVRGPFVKFSWLNPMTIFHNFYMAGNSNSIAGVHLSASFANQWSAYGEFVLDEMKTVTEGETKPNAFGYLAGVRKAGSVSSSHLYLLQLEAAYTDPYLYLRDIRDEPIDFIVGQRQPVENSLVLADEDFLGFPLGPDALILSIRGELVSLDSWQLNSELTYLLKGCIDQTSEYQTGESATQLSTPTATDPNNPAKDAVEHRLIWSADGWYPLQKRILIGLHTAWIHRWNPENETSHPYTQDLQGSFRIRVHL